MPAIAAVITAAACEAGYPGVKVPGIPGRPDAEAKPGPEAWRKVGDWVEKTESPQVFWVVLGAIDGYYVALHERMEGFDCL